MFCHCNGMIATTWYFLHVYNDIIEKVRVFCYFMSPIGVVLFQMAGKAMLGIVPMSIWIPSGIDNVT
jgi:hypothetical protein